MWWFPEFYLSLVPDLIWNYNLGLWFNIVSLYPAYYSHFSTFFFIVSQVPNYVSHANSINIVYLLFQAVNEKQLKWQNHGWPTAESRRIKKWNMQISHNSHTHLQQSFSTCKHILIIYHVLATSFFFSYITLLLWPLKTKLYKTFDLFHIY